MSLRPALLITVLLQPERIKHLPPRGWEVLIRQARSAQLLPRLATVLTEQNMLEYTPCQPLNHLKASLNVLARQRQAVRWEVEHLLLAFEQAEVPLVLLKGAAYEMAGLPPGRCRIFSDFDLLVPRSRLAHVETVMMIHGWSSAQQDTYDQRYYRTWMHELPPMRHITRDSVLDVHHNVVPETARHRPDPARLLDASIPCPERPEIRVLNGHDMILHSAVHLFHDGEFDHALRDLFDIRDLINHFIRTDADWLVLGRRAVELDLAYPLFYALRYLGSTLSMQIPSTAFDMLNDCRSGAMGLALRDAAFERALQPDNPTSSDWLTGLARFTLYVRGHALRMPLHLLLPHLLRKALIRLNLLPETGELRRAANRPGPGTH